MTSDKFILFGEDKKTLSSVKNALVSNGYVYIGYSQNTYNILRHVRSCYPELVIIEITNKFTELRPVLEVLDEELLTACILIFETRNDEVVDFLRNRRVITYLIKPVFYEVVVQTADLTLMNFKRVIEYEQKVKKLNEAIESRKIIEKAKWILVERKGYTESEAYEIIKKKSRDNRITMKETAQAILLAND